MGSVPAQIVCGSAQADSPGADLLQLQEILLLEDASHETDVLLDQLLAESLLSQALAAQDDEACVVLRGGDTAHSMPGVGAKRQTGSFFSRLLRGVWASGANAVNDCSVQQAGC